MKVLTWMLAGILILLAGCSDGSGELDTLIASEQSLGRFERQLDWTLAAAKDQPDNEGLETEQEAWRTGLHRCLDAEEPARCVAEAYRERLADLQARFDLNARAVAVHAAGRAGFDFRAVGNEPGWNLLLSRTHGIWETGYGQTLHQLDNISVEIDGTVRIYRTRLDDKLLEIRVEEAPCADDMSGDGFDFRFEIKYDGQTWRGCGDASSAS
jgi:uncharacterized membrane protein